MRFTFKKIVVALSACMVLSACTTEEDEANTDNTPPVASFDNALSVDEGSPSESVNATIRVSLNRNYDSEVSLQYATTDGTAITDSDFRATSDTLTFAPGERQKQIVVPIISNEMYANDKVFYINLSEPNGLSLADDQITVTIVNDDPQPTLAFANDKFASSELAGQISVPVVLSNPSELTTSFTLDIAGTASRGNDYLLERDTFDIEPGAREFDIPLEMVNDSIKEGGETIILRLASSTYAEIESKKNNLTVIVRGDAALPDTGARTYYDGESFTASAPDSDHPLQDADYGHDASATGSFDENGYAAFEYSKLDIHGNVLPQTATEFYCVRDNQTGVTFEVRPYAGASEGPASSRWRILANTHHWYSDDDTNNGGSRGVANSSVRLVKSDGAMTGDSCTFPDDGFNYHTLSGCSSHNYINRLNSVGLCGFNDWRLPTINEAQSIAIFTAETYLDDRYFSSALVFDADTRIPTSSPSADNQAAIWCLNPSTSRRELCLKSHKMSIHAARRAD